MGELLTIGLWIAGFTVVGTGIWWIADSLFKQYAMAPLKQIPGFKETAYFFCMRKGIAVDVPGRKICVIESHGLRRTTHVYNAADLLSAKVLVDGGIATSESSGAKLGGALLFGAAGHYFARAAYSKTGFIGRIETEFKFDDGTPGGMNHTMRYLESQKPDEEGQKYLDLANFFVTLIEGLAILEASGSDRTSRNEKAWGDFCDAARSAAPGILRIVRQEPPEPDEVILSVCENKLLVTNCRVYTAAAEGEGPSNRVVRFSDIDSLERAKDWIRDPKGIKIKTAGGESLKIPCYGSHIALVETVATMSKPAT
jgi:hypothetical protein